jgi:hypothetical protein
LGGRPPRQHAFAAHLGEHIERALERVAYIAERMADRVGYRVERLADRMSDRAEYAAERAAARAERQADRIRVESRVRVARSRVERRLGRTGWSGYSDQGSISDNPCDDRDRWDDDTYRHCEVREERLPAAPLAVDAGPNGGIRVEGCRTARHPRARRGPGQRARRGRGEAPGRTGGVRAGGGA